MAGDEMIGGGLGVPPIDRYAADRAPDPVLVDALDVGAVEGRGAAGWDGLHGPKACRARRLQSSERGLYPQVR